MNEIEPREQYQVQSIVVLQTPSLAPRRRTSIEDFETNWTNCDVALEIDSDRFMLL